MEAESEMRNWVKGLNGFYIESFMFNELSPFYFKFRQLSKCENELWVYVTNLDIFSWLHHY